ncbi:MAG: hypothetical protein AAFQ94_03700 [Bacteroidota bacterium]
MNKKLKKFKKHELSNSMKRKILGGTSCETTDLFNRAFDFCYDSNHRGEYLTGCIDLMCRTYSKPVSFI